MSFAEIFEETMKARARGDKAREEELLKMHNEKVAELRAKRGKK